MNKNNEYKLRFKRRKKEEALNFLGGKCSICGYNKCMGSLDFHHLDPTIKETNLSLAIIQWKWERVKPELEKCIVLCANCHREIHYKSVPHYEMIHLIRPVIKMTCPVCKNEFETKNEDQIYCSVSCRSFSDRKTIRPTKKELGELIQDDSISWLKIGKMFGVSDTAVRKWAKQYDLI